MEIQIHPTELSEGESGSDEEVTEPIVDPMEIQIHPTEMSQGENGSVGEATVPIVDRVEIQIHPTERSQGENGSNEEALHQCLTSTIVQNIGEGVQKTESFSSASIYRVPEYIRKHKESAYTPCLIAIGPLHRKDKHLQTPLQHVKMSYTNHLLSRLTEQTKFMVVQECLAEMKTLVDDAKKYYAEEVTLDEKMMLVDGCFILEFLYRYLTLTKEKPLKAAEAAEAEEVKDEGPKKDPIRVGNTLKKVKSDLVLLENQIPFNVLDKLFHLTVGQISDRPNKDWSLTNYVRWCYADEMMPERNSNNRGYIKSTLWSSSDCVLRVFGKNIDHHGSTAKYNHILHYLHDGYLQPLDKANQINFDFTEMPSASELVNAGVKFAPDTGNDLFKFKFSEPLCHIRARFEIPPLPIYEETESYLRNLIAFEQCCPGILLHVSSYAFVMDLLVDDKKDIQVLEEAGVLRNYLGTTKEAADLFNKLCKEIAHDEYFADTCSKATKYSKQFWPKNVALARRTYFASPVTFIAYCFGFIYFITSFLDFLNGPTLVGT